MAEADVRRHYGSRDLTARILAALTASGRDVKRLKPDDLIAVDEFHSRGRLATVDLARALALQCGDHVLDLGSGLGGPARYMARTYGCRVTGIDLTPEFVATAKELSALVGMADLATFAVGNALDIPFPEASFDVVWAQNVAMNVADRARLYAEIARVLKPGGRYGFTDIVTASGGAPHYPMPWARTDATSFLCSQAETERLVAAAGLEIAELVDQTADALAQSRARLAKDKSGPPASAGIHLILGDAWLDIARNMVRNYEESRTRLIQGVARKSASAGSAASRG